MTLYVLAVVECPVLPVWAGLEVNTTARRYLTAIEYRCTGDYQFPDRASKRVSKCDYRGNWSSEAFVSCVGQSLRIFITRHTLHEWCTAFYTIM